MNSIGRVGAGGLLLVLGLGTPAHAQRDEQDRGGRAGQQEHQGPADSPRREPPRQEPQRQEPQRQEPQRQEPQRQQPQQPQRQEPQHQQPQRQQPQPQQPPRPQPQRQEPQRQPEAPRAQQIPPPSTRPEAPRAQHPAAPAPSTRPEAPRAQQAPPPSTRPEPPRAQHPAAPVQRAEAPRAPRPPEGREVQHQAAWQTRRAGDWRQEHRSWQDRGGYGGYRIPQARYQVAFGPSHFFRLLSFPVLLVDGYPRFQYGGYWVSVLDPWPEYWEAGWYGNDDVYVDFAEGGYYLFNRRYPMDRLAVLISVD